jgi:hypothetical protein
MLSICRSRTQISGKRIIEFNPEKLPKVMFQTMNQPFISFHNHADILEKYDNVCHVIHKIASSIKQLEHNIVEI